MKVYILMIGSDDGYRDPLSLHLSLDDAKAAAVKHPYVEEGREQRTLVHEDEALRWVKASNGSCEFADFDSMFRAYVFERDLVGASQDCPDCVVMGCGRHC